MAARRREEPSQELVWAEEAWKGGGERQRANLGSHGVFYRRLAKARELLLACPPHRGSRGGSLPSSPPGTHSHSRSFAPVGDAAACQTERRSPIPSYAPPPRRTMRSAPVLSCFVFSQHRHWICMCCIRPSDANWCRGVANPKLCLWPVACGPWP